MRQFLILSYSRIIYPSNDTNDANVSALSHIPPSSADQTWGRECVESRESSHVHGTEISVGGEKSRRGRLSAREGRG